MSSQFGELRSINGWDRLVSLGHPSKFQRVSRLGFVTAPTSLNGDQPKLCTMFGRLLACNVYTFWWFLSLSGIFPGSKFTLRPNLAFFYISSITARHSSRWRQPSFVAFSRGRHLYSAGQPSRWTSAHILVICRSRILATLWCMYAFCAAG